MKFLVTATQLITQDVKFIVDVPEDSELPFEEAAMNAVSTMATAPSVQLYDARDEVYHRNIVTNVRLATEEESK